MALTLSRFKNASQVALASGAMLAIAFPLPEARAALTFADIAPIYSSQGDESAVQIAIGAGSTSFGYFFEVETDGKFLNALGFSAQLPTPTTNYDVVLWKYANGGLDVDNDYTQLASATFTPACVGTTCILKDFFYWLEVPTVALAKTSDDVNVGYAITAVGNFFSASEADVFYDGSGSFSSDVTFTGAGYNYTGGSGNPIPFGQSGDIPGFTNDSFAFFNSNASLFDAPPSVPGPLPLFGAAAAFGWTRKLRRRISAAG